MNISTLREQKREIANRIKAENKLTFDRLKLEAALGAPGLTSASGLQTITFTHLNWLNPLDLAPFNILARTMILFCGVLLQPLLNVFSKYLSPDGCIHLVHDISRGSLPHFLALAQKDLAITLVKQVNKKQDRTPTAIVNRLTRKKT